MIYLIPLLVIILCCYIYDYKHSQKGRLLTWILLLLYLICLAGFRYRMGNDSVVYEKFFNQLPSITEIKPIHFQESRFAPGFVVLVSICKSISNDFMLVQFVISSFINTVIFWFFWKNTRHIFFALLIYVCFQYVNLNMEVLREAMAVGFFLLAWPYFRDGKWIYYYILCGCGLLFHVSAVVLLILPIICIPGIRQLFIFGARTWFIGSLILIISLIVAEFFFKYIQMLAIAENISERAEAYSKNDLGGGVAATTFGFLSRFIKNILYPLLALYFLNIIKKRQLQYDNGLIKIEQLTIVSIYISLLSVGIFILSRYNNYLFFFPMIIMSDWIYTFVIFKGRKFRLEFVTWMIIFLPMFITLYFTFYNNKVNSEGTLRTYMVYYPYEDGFNKEMNADREKVFRYQKAY